MMRQISDLKKLTGGRYLVTLDDGGSFPLYRKELDAYGIAVDSCITEEDYTEIMQEVLPKRARMRAMYLLKNMDRTEWQLRRKLEELQYPAEIVEDALSYVKNYHYIDDLRYAVSYMEFRREGKSMRQMEQELYQKGIAKEVVQEAASQIDTPDEETQIRELLQKKHYDPEQADRRETERVFRFLARRGYASSLILQVMRETQQL